MTIENREGVRLLKLMYPQYSSKIDYLPVGVNDVFISTLFENKIKDFNQKENIILTTGRIGAAIKNHEMILRSLVHVDMKDWKMVFIGSVNPNFMNYFNELSISHPHLKSQVVFVDEITDREALYAWYNKSKVFCMTSLRESFSIAIAEAFYFGNYIIGTEGIMSMKDITDNGKYGEIIKYNDDEALIKAIQNKIDHEENGLALYNEMKQHSNQHFVWSKIIEDYKTEY